MGIHSHIQSVAQVHIHRDAENICKMDFVTVAFTAEWHPH